MANVSGTVYVDRGVTPMGAGRTLNYSLAGGASSGSTTTASDGTYTISGVNVNNNNVCVVYLQGNTENGVALTIASGVDITGLDVWQDCLTLRDGGHSLTPSVISTSDNNGATGLSAIYAGTSAFVMSTANGKSLVVMSGSTLGSLSSLVTITCGGDFVKNGSLAGAPKLILNGTGTQTISGGPTFFSVVATTAGDVIKFTDGTTTTVTSAVTFQNVTLQGTGSAGWTLACPATQTIDHVTVSHSTATGNTAIAGTGSVDGGANVNWTFPSAGGGTPCLQSGVLGSRIVQPVLVGGRPL